MESPRTSTFVTIGDVVCESVPAVYESASSVEDAFRAIGRSVGDVPDAPSGEFVLREALEQGISLEDIARLYTLLEDCVVRTINPEDASRKDIKTKSISRVTSNFEVRTVFAPFYSPNTRSYRYVRIEIRNSIVKVAGKGAFAADVIKEGEYGFYRGLIKTSKTHNHAYSWEVNEFRANGTARSKVVGYLDATSATHSNWARYANCPNFDFKNNLTMTQRYHLLTYEAVRDIYPGDELFIDYGPGYRTTSLGIDDETYSATPQCWECGGEVVFSEDRHDYHAHTNYFECESCQEKMVWCDEGMHTLPLEEAFHTVVDLAKVVCAECVRYDEGEGEATEGEATEEDPDLSRPLE